MGGRGAGHTDADTDAREGGAIQGAGRELHSGVPSASGGNAPSASSLSLAQACKHRAVRLVWLCAATKPSQVPSSTVLHCPIPCPLCPLPPSALSPCPLLLKPVRPAAQSALFSSAACARAPPVGTKRLPSRTSLSLHSPPIQSSTPCLPRPGPVLFLPEPSYDITTSTSRPVPFHPAPARLPVSVAFALSVSPRPPGSRLPSRPPLSARPFRCISAFLHSLRPRPASATAIVLARRCPRRGPGSPVSLLRGSTQLTVPLDHIRRAVPEVPRRPLSPSHWLPLASEVRADFHIRPQCGLYT